MWYCIRVLRIHFEGYCWTWSSRSRRYHRKYLWVRCWWRWQHLRQLRWCWPMTFFCCWRHFSNYCYYFSMRTELFGIPSQNHRAMAVPQLRALHANDEILLDRWLTLKLRRERNSQRLNAFAGLSGAVVFFGGMAFSRFTRLYCVI